MRWRIQVSGLLLLAPGLAVWAGTPPGRVNAVHDDDTLTVLVNGREPAKILLAGIDTLERDQSFGQCNRRSLAELAFGKAAARPEPEVFLTGRGGAQRACVEMASCVEAWSYLGRLRNAPPHRRAVGVGNPDPEPVCL